MHEKDHSWVQAKQFLMLLDLDYRKWVYHKEFYVSSPKWSKAAALAIWDKARINSTARLVDSGVDKIRTLYESYSLLKKNIDLNE